MSNMRRITILSILWVIIIFSAVACTPKASGQEYDTLKEEVNAVFDELSTAQSELLEVKRELNATFSELNKTRDKLSSTESTLTDKLADIHELKNQLAEADIKRDKYLSQYEKLNIKYNELKAQYAELQALYDANVTGTTDINEKDVEQELFKLVNQDRKSNGLPELIWNGGLYISAEGNNWKMAETKALQHSETPSFQQVFWFLGNGTSERIASATLLSWQNNAYSYKQNVLNKSAIYGAVAALKSEEILYITFISTTDIHIR